MTRYMDIRIRVVDGIRYVWSIAPEETPIVGNVMASGDDAADAAAEQWVIDHLDSSEGAAWCTFRCSASVGGVEGLAYLGCCSYPTPDVLFEDLGGELGQDALDDLKRRVEAAAAGLAAEAVVTPRDRLLQWGPGLPAVVVGGAHNEEE